MTISIGEGSRGGHVIGHTRSGRPIYGVPKDMSHILGSINGGHLTIIGKRDVLVAEKRGGSWTIGHQSRRDLDHGYLSQASFSGMSTAEIRGLLQRATAEIRAVNRF